MFRKVKPFFIIAETSLHPGSGSELGIVDLPIQRERHTNWPKIEGSGLKGCIREAFESYKEHITENCVQEKLKKILERGGKINLTESKEAIEKAINLAFGPEDGELHAGALSFTDARVLLFPIKSLKGVFAWITCPGVLEDFKKNLRLTNQLPSELNVSFRDLENKVTSGSELTIEDDSDTKKIVLEEYTFTVKEDEKVDKLAEWLAQNIFLQHDKDDPYGYWRNKMKKSIVVLSGGDFTDLVSTTTEVIARTIINNETGTAKDLWYEEYLPSDTVLYSLAMASPVRVKEEEKGIFKVKDNEANDPSERPEKEAEKVLDFFVKGLPDIIQIGGNQTIGKGIVRTQILKDGGKNG